MSLGPGVKALKQGGVKGPGSCFPGFFNTLVFQEGGQEQKPWTHLFPILPYSHASCSYLSLYCIYTNLLTNITTGYSVVWVFICPADFSHVFPHFLWYLGGRRSHRIHHPFSQIFSQVSSEAMSGVKSAHLSRFSQG